MVHKHDFPEDFVWGTATAAHQVEGNNKNSDWWHWELNSAGKKGPAEASGIACDSYNRFEEDFDLCQKLNNNAVRISIEWARIEPERGKFDEHALDHYKKILKAAKERGLQTFVTLHHFTSPKWLADMGGWANMDTPELFAKYAERCEQEFTTLIDKYMTINEPQVYMSMSFLTGKWPPNKKNPILGLLVEINMQRAHKKAYRLIT
mgnify:FL=1